METIMPTRIYEMEDTDVLMAENDFPYVMRIRDMDDGQKPREKLQRSGPVDLSMAELVAVLLNVGTRREDVLQMSHRVLQEYGERTIMHEKNPVHLAEALDIPVAKACQLVASLEIGRRFYESRAGKPTVVRTANQAYAHVRDMAHLRKELLRALYLNSRYHVVHEEVVSVGSLTANIVHPREVFQPAVERGAAAVVIAHNHPSGSLEPTSADLEVTAQLFRGGQLLGIELLDHLIIAGESYLSIIGERYEL